MCSPAEVPRHPDRIVDGVEESHVGEDRVAVGGLDVERVHHPVGLVAEHFLPLVEVAVHRLAARPSWAFLSDSSRS